MKSAEGVEDDAGLAAFAENYRIVAHRPIARSREPIVIAIECEGGRFADRAAIEQRATGQNKVAVRELLECRLRRLKFRESSEDVIFVVDQPRVNQSHPAKRLE